MRMHNENCRFRRLWMIGLFMGVIPSVSSAMQPLYPADVERLRNAGTLQAHYDFVRAMKNYEIRPDLMARKANQLRAYRPGAKVLPQAFPDWFSTGLPSRGRVNMFALLIEFPNSDSDPGVDYTHTLDRIYFDNCLFGNGTASEFPYESLRSYYLRSSHGVLEINGTALGWYKAKNTRNTYSSDNGIKSLIKEALDNLTETHDFTVYDNDGDGKIDYFICIYTGPVNGEYWWAWNDLQGSMFEGDPYTVDGKRLGVFTWMWEKNLSYPATTAQVAIHETGHALGLPDYYDYEPGVGPEGGVGGMDIMDWNIGDHNCFSKWLLDWVDPVVISTTGTQSVTLRSAADFADAVLVMPGFDPANPFSEFFMVQNRRQTGNDLELPNSGIIIWHVDATLQSPPDPTDSWAPFAFNNSTTPHKLLRLMEADGCEDIERFGVADAGDFYEMGDTFGTDTTPNSNDYEDSATGIVVDNISATGPIMNVSVSITGANYRYGLKVIPLGVDHIYGTVTPLSGKFDPGSVVILEAKPEFGYRLKKWTNTDDDASTANINTVTMTKSKTVYVEFERIPTVLYTISASVVGGHGKLWPLDLTYLEGTKVTVACDPDPGYQVKKWTGTDDDNLKTNTNTVTMTDNKTITVEFEPVPAMGTESVGMAAPPVQTTTPVATGEIAADSSDFPGFGTLVNSCVALSIVLLGGLALATISLVRVRE